jgi:malate/lactate dehydrogenase
MGVTTDGSYGVPPGLIFSFPVVCSNGKYTIVKGLQINDFSKKYLENTKKELIEEKQTAGL